MLFDNKLNLGSILDVSKDYYAILGVLPSIEPTALKAVYLALLKKYHPDIYKGNVADAERITKELNEAFGVLGDQSKRAEYDGLRKEKSSDGGDFSQEGLFDNNENIDFELNKDWKIIEEYYPEVELHRKEIYLISKSLSKVFQYIILTEKLSDRSKELLELLKNEFLKRYFGSNEKLQNFALKMLKENRRDVALELNNIARIIGDTNDEKIKIIIRTVSLKFKLMVDYKNKIKYVYQTYNLLRNGEYYAVLDDGSVIGSVDNKLYYHFENEIHYMNETTKNVNYLRISGFTLTKKFYDLLEKQDEITRYI